MEDVRAVAVDVDAIEPLGVGVAADVRPSFDDEALLPRLSRFVGEHAAEQPRPHDEIVVLRHSLLLFVLLLHSPGRGQPRARALFYFINSAGKMQALVYKNPPHVLGGMRRRGKRNSRMVVESPRSVSCT